MDKAHEMRFPSMAITDHGVMYGAIDFYRAAREKGIKPIIGCEVYVAPGSRLEKKSSSAGRDVYNHLVLLAKDEEGYKNLVKLTTAAHLEGYYYKPRVDKELLERHKGGLIALSGCLASEICDAITKDQLAKARAAIDWFKQVLGPENFYLELQNHGIPEQAKVNQLLIPWAREFGLKLVASNDVHYVEKGHSHAHDCLICLGTQTQLADTKRMRYVQEQFYLRSPEEMKARFAEIPEAISNTLEVAEKCNLEIKFGELHYPVFTPPEHFTRDGYLRHVLTDGLRDRYGLGVRAVGTEFEVDSLIDARKLPTFTPPADAPPGPLNDLAHPAVAAAVKALLDRLGMELKVIEKTGFVSYFLIVGDFIRKGHEMGVACVARGSAAGSIVTYLLGISNVDPIRYGLLFERFLNPERVNPPDIDIDFADDRRADVIAYVREKYGRDAVAQIITFGTMGAKSVVRDVGRVMGLDYNDCDRLAKMVPADLKMTLEKALKDSPDLKKAYDTEEVTRELIDTAFILEDLTRNASVHAAGVVIAGEPLVNLLPLKADDDGGIVTQYAMGPVGDLGLLKMDFLGLKTLTVIRNTCEMVKRLHGIEIPIDNLPLDDAKSYDLLNRANTSGVFQLESSGMRDLCRKFAISSVEHITALIALYRPGPMDLIPEFIKRRNGEVKIEYEHPALEPICRETYGIMVYQEQVMQAAQVLAGFTLGGADLLRRAMGKKKKEEMDKMRATFVKGCEKVHAIPQAKANQIFDLLEKFAGYGFNKSHAAAYAIVSYQTAWLKANHPVEFYCAMMTNDMGDTAKLSEFINEARASGIEVLPPDVNESGIHFTPAPGKPAVAPAAGGNGAGQAPQRAIRFGLAAIKGVGELAVQALLKARDGGARFTTLAELCERVDDRSVNRRVLEALVKTGACDCLGQNRATLFASIEHCLARASGILADRRKGQSSLFGTLNDQGPASPAEPAALLPEWPQHELLAHEKELLGFYVTGHPLTPYAPLIEKFGLATTTKLPGLANRSMTRVAGMVSVVQAGVSKKSGKPYALATIEDLEGSVQVLCLNENFDKFRDLLQTGKVLLIVGEVNLGDDKPKLFPVDIMLLEDAPRRYTRQVHLRLNSAHVTPVQLDALHGVVTGAPGRCPLLLCFMRPAGDRVFIEVHDRFRVTPSLAFQTAMNDLFGREAYYAKVDTTLPERPRRSWEKKESGGGGGDE